MGERLTERGFEVVEAESGEKALELLDQFAFDIVITDLRMPGVDGVRVIEVARERYPGIVALVITGYGPSRMRWMRSSGAHPTSSRSRFSSTS
jgi:CheY-like chemotaxis protein